MPESFWRFLASGGRVEVLDTDVYLLPVAGVALVLAWALWVTGKTIER